MEGSLCDVYSRLLKSVIELEWPFGSENTSLWRSGQRLRRRAEAEAYLANVDR